MVFGFGKKKAHESPATPTQKERTVLLEEIPRIIQELELPHITETINTAKIIKGEIEIIKEKIHDLIVQLESDDLNLDDVDRNLGIIVKRGKNSVVSIIKKETSSVMTDITNYEQVTLLNTEINIMLKRIGDVLGLNSRIIHIFAKKYADNFKDEIAKISNSRNRLQSSVNFIENFRNSCKNIINNVEKVLEQRKKVLQKNERILEINSEMESLRNNIIHLEKQILDLKSSNSYAKFSEIKSKIHSISSEKYEIKNILDMQLSKISRPLGKYSYISSFEKPVKKMMDQLISDPYDIISQQNKNTIIQILEAVTKSVSSGSISVKDTDKSLEQIQETISRLDEFITLKESYSNKISSLENDLTIFDSRLLESIEYDLQNKKTNYINLESIKKKLELEIKETNNLVIKHISEIESDLANLTNSRISIKA